VECGHGFSRLLGEFFFYFFAVQGVVRTKRDYLAAGRDVVNAAPLNALAVKVVRVHEVH